MSVGRKLEILGRQLVLRAYGVTFLIGATPRTARTSNALAPLLMDRNNGPIVLFQQEVFRISLYWISLKSREMIDET